MSIISFVRARGAQLFRYFFGIIALLWVISRGQWQESLDTLANVSSFTIVILILLVVVGLLFRFLTWYAFLIPETPVLFRVAAEIDLMVNFLNQLLPSRLSGRAAAPLVVSQRTGLDLGISIGIAGINTAMYAIIYGLVSGVGLIFIRNELSLGLLGVVGASTGLYIAAGVIILLAGTNATAVNTTTKQVVPILERVPAIGMFISSAFERIPEFTEQSMAVFKRTLSSPSPLALYTIGWVGSAAVFPALRVAVLFDSFGVNSIPFLTLPAILVAAYSVTLLPITPGGIGITEATATAVFVSLGVSYEIAAATILVDRVLGVYLPALMGWYPLIRKNPLTSETA